MKIEKHEYAPYYHTYVKNFLKKDPLAYLEETQVDFYESIPCDRIAYSYGPDKWTIAQVLNHITDAERIFTYRALRIARGDKTPMAGFDQDDYIDPADANTRPWMSLLDEYLAVRQSSVALFKSMRPEDLKNKGVASDTPVSAKALLFMTAGHEYHHIKIIKEKYLF